MNHPNTEQWMSYLYGELPNASRISLKVHLGSCAECRQHVENWQAVMKRLGKWQLPTANRAAHLAFAQPALKWALAALVVLGLGYGIGRFSAPSANVEVVKAAIEKPLKASLTAEIRQAVQDQMETDWQAVLTGEPSSINTDFRRQLRAGLDQWTAGVLAAAGTQNQQVYAEFAEASRANRLQDQRTILTALDRIEQKRQADQLNLRRAVETVALVAADKFQRTDSELGQLASYAQAQLISEQSDEPMDSTKQQNRKGN